MSRFLLADEDIEEFLLGKDKSFQELSVVHKLGNLLNSSLELDYVINKAVTIVGKLMLADCCALLLAEETSAGLTITLSALYGASEALKKLKNDFFVGSLPYHALNMQEPLITGDAANCPYVSKELNKITKAQSIMAVPVTSKGVNIGALCVFSRERDFFSDDDLHFMKILSDQIGIAVMNANLFRKTELMAQKDSLTDLHNHNYFLKYLDDLIVTQRATDISLILIDLDGFKFINEQFGHKTGDQVLIQAATILREFFGPEIMLARYGGDEFAIVLPHIQNEQALFLAEDVRKKIASSNFVFANSPTPQRLTASIGIASFPQDGATSMELIDKVNRAMYRVKRSAGDRVETYLADLKDLHLTEFDQAFFDIIRILINSLDSRDQYTREHSREVAHYAAAIASELGLSRPEVELIRLAGYLHDIGKLHLDYSILSKPTKLSEDEYRAVKLHPVVGANLISPIQGFAQLVPLVLYHHEWFNGHGYPSNLAGHDIPIGARIIAIADGFDAMTTNRPYRKAMTEEEAIAELVRMKGTQYQPELVDAMLRVLESSSLTQQKIG